MDDAREPLLIFPNNDANANIVAETSNNKERNKLSASVDNATVPSSKLIQNPTFKNRSSDNAAKQNSAAGNSTPKVTHLLDDNKQND